MNKPTFISLFAGIGGLDLGLERAGWRCVAQVEIDEYATRVLNKHWPDVPKFGDVRSVGAHNLPPTDLICGGFPCQDISNAGRRAGIEGERSGLWSEFARIIGELRPRYVLVENVPALLGRGFGRVLGDLAACGYDAEWQCVPAAAVGAPHIRDRVFILAYARGNAGTRRRMGLQHCQKETVRHHNTQQRENKTRLIPETRSPIVARLGSYAWEPEPALDRMAYGIPHRMDRLRGLGNAVVPQVAEFVGRCILEAA